MDTVTRGRVRALKETVANEVPQGSRVLEIGCGTGELAGLMIQKGCTVDGFDLSPAMVDAAHARIQEQDLQGRFRVEHMGVEAMDGFPSERFDAVVSMLVFSELNRDERQFALKHAARVLRPCGVMVVADEVVAKGTSRRLMQSMARMPLLAATYLVAGKSTRPLTDLAGEIRGAGFIIDKEIRGHGDRVAMVVGRKPGRAVDHARS
jgi:demethylmenaquinone methyltransferase/2-methoxy-6-polyprenyl-1,4-benzoquinol methylase